MGLFLVFVILFFLKEAVVLKVDAEIRRPIGSGTNWEDENNTDIISTWYNLTEE